MTAEYTLEHPDVRTLQLQIDELASRVSSLPVSNVDTTVIHLRGNVELRTDTMVLTADEADYYGGTGEIVPRGNVRVRPTSK